MKKPWVLDKHSKAMLEHDEKGKVCGLVIAGKLGEVELSRAAMRKLFLRLKGQYRD